MKKLNNIKIAILTEKGFEEIELKSPKQALESEGAIVHIVSPQKGTVLAKKGDDWSENYAVDIHLDDASADQYDALLIPGGVINPDKLRTNEKALLFVRDFFKQKKPIAAICHGPQVLIDAEVIEGRKMTSVNAIRKDLQNAGAEWVDEEVVTDKGLTTSRTPKDLPAFNARIVEEFSKPVADEN